MYTGLRQASLGFCLLIHKHMFTLTPPDHKAPVSAGVVVVGVGGDAVGHHQPPLLALHTDHLLVIHRGQTLATLTLLINIMINIMIIIMIIIIISSLTSLTPH